MSKDGPYRTPTPTVDILIELDGRPGPVVLIARQNEPRGWAIPGGFVQMDESLELAARRELEEETGIRDIYMEQLYTFGDPKRDPRMRVISVAYIALVRHDTAGALRVLASLPDSLCALCYQQRVTLAQLLSARREDGKAAKLLDRWLSDLSLPSSVFWTLERGRVAERMGDREKAIRSYQYVARVWRHADPELQPYVAEAREGLKRMTSEPR